MLLVHAHRMTDRHTVHCYICSLPEEANQTNCMCEHISFTQIKSEADRNKNKKYKSITYKYLYTTLQCEIVLNR